ncbi:hypothetical protein DVH24_040077 [Malus domestica]|uniref:RING-type E3 ubiquitin transferase n=1 Tax=Malus domestica TaxID=3750 RepID=A0A498I3J1_MALDO|nr:hypothetical protein DVH24_040077 [Malus domestica]
MSSLFHRSVNGHYAYDQNIDIVFPSILWLNHHTATLEICNFLIYFLFFLFHPHSASTTCGGSNCSDGGPLVRFPFQLTNHQAKTNCGYPGYDLSCNNRSQTTLTLPSFGDFTVQTINYMIQVVSISDPDNCLPKRFLHHETSLVENSPFLHRTFSSLVNYTFFNCSSSEVGSMPSRIISCLSTEYFKVIALRTSWLLPPYPIPLPLCSVISTTLAPSLFDWDNHDIELTWKVPDCRLRVKERKTFANPMLWYDAYRTFFWHNCFCIRLSVNLDY